MSAEVNFVRQQGFRDAAPEACGARYPGLMFQPRVVGVLALVGIVLQDWRWFAVLGAVLWWGALFPKLNLFDLSYNLVAAARLGPAPGPRRFSQGMAGTFMLLISALLAGGFSALAWAVEGMLVAALAALVFGRFCLGSYVFLLLSGERGFANRTLPWRGRG